MAILRISAQTNLFNTTRAIVSMIHDQKHAEIQAIGYSAIQRAEKAIAQATAVLEEEGIDIFSMTRIIKPGQDGNEKIGLRFIIKALQSVR